MADPNPVRPINTDAGAVENPIARSVLGVMRRTERALSPWVQRLVGAEFSRPKAAASARAAFGAAPPSETSQGMPFSVLNRPAAVISAPSLTLAARVQRLAEKTSVMQRNLSGSRTTAMLGRLAVSIENRFPAVAAKYEMRPLNEARTLQRSQMPVAEGEESAAPEIGAAPILPESFEAEPEMPSIDISPDDSIAAHLAARLQTFRQADQSAPVVQPSPRQISRMVAERAPRSAKPASTERSKIRRAVVEEFDSHPPAPIGAGKQQTPTARSETIQRKIEEPPIQPESAAPPPTVRPAQPAPPLASISESRQPAVQRQPAPLDTEAISEPGDGGPNPSKPSLFHELAQRLADNRAAEHWPAPTESLGVQRKTEPATGESAPKPESRVQRPVEPKPPVVQRQAEPTPKQPRPKPEPPTLQRSVEPETLKEDLPLASKPGRADFVRDPEPALSTPVDSAPPAAIQRSPADAAESESASHSRESGNLEELAPDSRFRGNDVNSQAPASVVEAAFTSEAPTPEVTLPTIQRQVEPAAPPPETRAYPEAGPTQPVVEVESDSIPDKLTPAQPSSLSQPSAPRLQRQIADLPLRTPPAPPTSELPALGESVLSRAKLSLNLPLTKIPAVGADSSRAKVVQRQPVGRGPTVSRLQRATDAGARGALPAGEAAPALAEPLPLTQAQPRQGWDEGKPFDIAPPSGTSPGRRESLAVTTPTLDLHPVGVLQRAVETEPVEPALPLPELPLVRAPQPAPTAKIQRHPHPDDEAGDKDEDEVDERDEIEHDEDEDDEISGRKSSPIDLHNLARKVYPLIKRMLAIERERW